MKKILLILVVLSVSTIAKSQIKALTDDGTEVVLFNDGTWKYAEEDSSAVVQDSLVMNPVKFKKSPESNFLVKSKVLNIGVNINPAKWAFSSNKDNQTNPEYTFSYKKAEGYAMLISERTEIDLVSMREIALLNAQKASLDVKEVSAEYRMVNNLKVLCLKLQGTVKGIKFVYFGYYYSNENGTIQLVSFASSKYFNSIQKELEILLNGLVELESKK